MSTNITPKTAPRDMNGLKALTRTDRFRLAIQLQMVSQGGAEAEQAFLAMNEDQQAQALLAALTQRDQSGNGQSGPNMSPQPVQQMQPMGPPPQPVYAQPQMPAYSPPAPIAPQFAPTQQAAPVQQPGFLPQPPQQMQPPPGYAPQMFQPLPQSQPQQFAQPQPPQGYTPMQVPVQAPQQQPQPTPIQVPQMQAPQAQPQRQPQTSSDPANVGGQNGAGQLLQAIAALRAEVETVRKMVDEECAGHVEMLDVQSYILGIARTMRTQNALLFAVLRHTVALPDEQLVQMIEQDLQQGRMEQIFKGLEISQGKG